MGLKLGDQIVQRAKLHEAGEIWLSGSYQKTQLGCRKGQKFEMGCIRESKTSKRGTYYVLLRRHTGAWWGAGDRERESE